MESLPRIIYGTAWKKADTAELIRTAVELGFRGIDTAFEFALADAERAALQMLFEGL